MKQLIMIKYAELTTKKDNRGYFVKILKQNIMDALKGINYELSSSFVRMYIYTSEVEKVVEKLKKISGIHEIVIAYESEKIDVEDIKNSALDLLKNEEFKTFKVETKRSIKTYPIKSMDISRMVGAHLLKNINDLKVDVNNPDVLLNIELRDNKVYFYFKTYEGIGGYPVGVLGKGLLMLSGGIDSPVAAYLASKRGVKLEYIYFDSPPHTSSEARNKVINLARKLKDYTGSTVIHVINFTHIQEEILKNCPHDYLITLMRRMMYRISEAVAKNNNCLAIFNGENIGQVASQTLTSISVINSVVDIPVIRPLATYDKLDIIKIAKEIGTYETSILPYEDCCTVFVPKHPVINPTNKKALISEEALDIDFLINEALEKMYEIEIKEEKRDELL